MSNVGNTTRIWRADKIENNTSSTISLDPVTDIHFEKTAEFRAQAEARFRSGSNSNYVAIKAPAALTENTVYILPEQDGADGQALSTDGAGVLSWKDGAAIALQELLVGVVNGINTTFNVTSIATTDESIWLFLDGVLVEKSEYSFDAQTGVVIFNTAPEAGQRVYAVYLSVGAVQTSPVLTGGTLVTEYHTVTAGEEAAKSFTINQLPLVAADTIVDVRGFAAVERFGQDFTVSGSTFSWGGFGLDGLLLENDIVRLIYLT